MNYTGASTVVMRLPLPLGHPQPTAARRRRPQRPIIGRTLGRLRLHRLRPDLLHRHRPARQPAIALSPRHARTATRRPGPTACSSRARPGSPRSPTAPATRSRSARTPAATRGSSAPTPRARSTAASPAPATSAGELGPPVARRSSAATGGGPSPTTPSASPAGRTTSSAR